MAYSLKDVETKINATKNTMQITKAMEMVSQSKVKKSQKALNSYKLYLDSIHKLTSQIMANVESTYKNPLILDARSDKTLYLLITSDKGLCGAYNANVYKAFKEEVKNVDPTNVTVASLGKMGFSFTKRNNYNLYYDKVIHVRDDVMYIDLEPLFDTIIEGFMKRDFDQIKIVYNHFVNSLTTEVKVETLLPFKVEQASNTNIVYNYEMGVNETLDEILPICALDILYGIILDSKAAEHQARVNSMRNATDNAKDVISKLQLLYNKARQEGITNELNDIIGGASFGGGK